MLICNWICSEAEKREKERKEKERKEQEKRKKFREQALVGGRSAHADSLSVCRSLDCTICLLLDSLMCKLIHIALRSGSQALNPMA